MRDRDVNVVPERRRGEWCPLKPAVAKQITLEAEPGQSRQCWQGARAIVRTRGLQFQVEQRAMLVAEGEQLDALDQLAAIDAARPGAWGGAEGPAVGHHRSGAGFVPAGPEPGQ